jgi:cytochrome b6-f complex iron-sulfur subunit
MTPHRREPPADDRPVVLSRRTLVARLATAVGLAALGAQAAAALHAIFGPSLSDPSAHVKIGLPASIADGLTFVQDLRVFVVRSGGRVRALSAVCTHLGCTVHAETALQPDPEDPDPRKATQVHTLACPCHGSRYAADGTNLSGPAPAPLGSIRVSIAPDDGQLVVHAGEDVPRSVWLTLP